MNTPKSDMERFIELYKSFRIDLKPEECNNGTYLVSLDESTLLKKFVGYAGFGSDIYFDKDGNFIKQGFYEE